jgi:RimJ/RimL family protein N-acetyltransferase
VRKRPQTRLPLAVDGLLLRRVGVGDLRDLLEYRSDPEVVRFQYWGPMTAEGVEEMLERQAQIQPGDPGIGLILAVEQDGKVIGDCQLNLTSPEHGQAEIGFLFHPRFTGRGLATRAVAVTLGFGFVQLGVHRITAATDALNERAWRLLERVGMRREGHFLHDGFAGGAWKDVYVYAMLADEWPRHHAGLAANVAVGEAPS